MTVGVFNDSIKEGDIMKVGTELGDAIQIILNGFIYCPVEFVMSSGVEAIWDTVEGHVVELLY